MNDLLKKFFLFAALLLSWAGFGAEALPGSSSCDANPNRKSEKSFRRRPPKAFFARLTPEERASLDQLARAGRKEELRKRMRELMYKYRPEEMKQLDALSERYLKNPDEQEKAAIRREMEKLAWILFRKRQDFTRNNIAAAEKQLARAQEDLQRLKLHYQRNEENREKIVAGQVERLCLPPEQRKKLERRPPFDRRPPRPLNP